MYNTDQPNRAELPSTNQLLRSTSIAALLAVALLVTTIFPAEFGIDITGIGRALGLAKMGEEKAALAKTEKALKQALNTDAATKIPSAEAPVPATSTAVTAATASTLASTTKAGLNTLARQDTTVITLKPGQAAELKLEMRKDKTVQYEWTVVGGKVNYDTHGDQGNTIKYHGYGKGRNETFSKGTLQAAFDGKHGWYWKNRSETDATITLKINGDYSAIERVL